MAKGETVERIIAQVRAAAPELPELTIERIARGIHADLGGDRHYVCKNPSQGKALGLRDAMAAGVPFVQAFSRARMSRGYGYKLRRIPWVRRAL